MAKITLPFRQNQVSRVNLMYPINSKLRIDFLYVLLHFRFQVDSWLPDFIKQFKRSENWSHHKQYK